MHHEVAETRRGFYNGSERRNEATGVVQWIWPRCHTHNVRGQVIFQMGEKRVTMWSWTQSKSGDKRTAFKTTKVQKNENPWENRYRKKRQVRITEGNLSKLTSKVQTSKWMVKKKGETQKLSSSKIETKMSKLLLVVRTIRNQYQWWMCSGNQTWYMQLQDQ